MMIILILILTLLTIINMIIVIIIIIKIFGGAGLPGVDLVAADLITLRDYCLFLFLLFFRSETRLQPFRVWGHSPM